MRAEERVVCEGNQRSGGKKAARHARRRPMRQANSQAIGAGSRQHAAPASRRVEMTSHQDHANSSLGAFGATFVGGLARRGLDSRDSRRVHGNTTRVIADRRARVLARYLARNDRPGDVRRRPVHRYGAYLRISERRLALRSRIHGGHRRILARRVARDAVDSPNDGDRSRDGSVMTFANIPAPTTHIRERPTHAAVSADTAGTAMAAA